jgi:SET domain-containing protein
MNNKTTHESFVLKPSKVSGVGVFALHGIARGTYLKLFTTGFEEEVRKVSDVPKELRAYCLTRSDGKLLCPKHFNRLDIGNYINHSNRANMTYKQGRGYFAKRNIRRGEELLGNYRELDEPEESREDYYK